MADFRVHDLGNLWTIEAVSDAGLICAQEHFEIEGWMGRWDRFTTDHRAAAQLCEQLAEDGYEIERAA